MLLPNHSGGFRLKKALKGYKQSLINRILAISTSGTVLLQQTLTRQVYRLFRNAEDAEGIIKGVNHDA